MHTALIDCDLLSKVYINLIDQKEPKLDFKNDEIDTTKENNQPIKYFKKVIVPTNEELEKHRIYLKNSLKKNYFS